MRVRTLEIRWHDSKPISTCDFQPVAFKKARPAQDKSFARQSYRLATGGEDNHVRVSALARPAPDLSCQLPSKVMDGPSEYYHPLISGGRVDRRGGCTGVAPAEGRVPRDAQPTLCCCQCCQIQPEWYTHHHITSSITELISCTGELIASAGDGEWNPLHI